MSDANVSIDGQVKITFDKPKINAFIEITRPFGNGKPCKREDVIEALKNNNISFVVKEEVINQVLQEGNWNKKFLIAEGKAPVNGQDAIITYNFPLPHEVLGKPKIDEKGNVDFHNLGLIYNVRIGDLLAERIPPQLGVDGINVMGEKISAKPGKDIRIPKGKNTISDNDDLKLYAAAAGHVSLIDNKVVVHPVYEHSGDVDYSSGDIEFVGNVLIRGNVNSGFKVKAEGDIEINGFVEGAEVIAGGNILIKGGITGGLKGIVKAGENIHARFVENSRLEAGRDIIIREAIMQSHVKAGDSIKVTDRRATIVGGVIQASQLVEAKIIGSQLATQTIIEVGIKPEYRDEYQGLLKDRNERKKIFDNLNHNLQIYQRQGISIEKLNERQRLALIKMLDELKKIKQEITNIEDRILFLEEEFNKINNARIRATELLFPGVRVSIGQSIYVVNDLIKYSQLVVDDGEIKLASL